METLPTPYCCDPCVPTGTSSTPGPQGTQGVAGTNGTNGLNAYATAVGDEPMPNDDGASSVTIATTTDTSWMAVGQVVYVQFWGYMRVTAKPTTTSVTLLNLADGTLYADNAAPGTLLTAGARISPGGWQGPAGAVAGGALLSANNLNDVANAATSRTNLGLGSVATFPQGNTDGRIPQVSQVGGLVTGEAVFAVASGIETKTAANARTALGLGTIATQAASAVAITGGALNGTLGATTPASAAVTTLAASGAASLAGTLAVTGASTLGPVFTPSTAIQSLLAATAISPNAAKIRVVGNGGAVVLTAVPTITTPAADGQLLLIMGTDNTNTVTLQDESSLAGTKLRLNGAANRVLGLYDTLLLSYDSVSGFWCEVAFSNN